MRFLRFTLPLSVAVGFVSSLTLAAEPVSSPLSQFGNYDSIAQAEARSPSDRLPPVMADVPQEDAYQMRALPPQEAAEEVEEGPNRWLETEYLKKRGISTYGWLDVGIGGNNWGSTFNGPITFNDRNWQAQMNQLYLVNEKVIDTADGGWDWGGRVDLLYGTDSIYTTARGLDAFLFPQFAASGVSAWQSSKDYGLALPQLYVELARDNVAVKLGHFYTIIGYEVVPAIGNFFYTHAYTMQYGEPFTHTGVLGTWTPNEQMVVYGGVTNGWDNWSDPLVGPGNLSNPGYPGSNSNAAFLGGITFKNSDATQSLTFTTSSGNEIGGFNATDYAVGNRTVLSTVYSNELSEKLTYVFQNDNGWQFNGLANGTGFRTNGQTNDLAQWYGVNQYLFWNFSETLVGGLRMEWFRDNNGTRVLDPLRNAAQPGNSNFTGGYQGNFWEMTWGLNYKPNKNWMVRPEVRYDWYTPDVAGSNLPYGSGIGTAFGANGGQSGQFYSGCDLIYQF